MDEKGATAAADGKALLLLGGDLCDDEFWRHPLDSLGDVAGMSVGDLGTGEDLGAAAERLLAAAPARFALCGFAMGGHVALEMVRRAPERVAQLALIGTIAGPDGSEALERRKALIRLIDEGNFRQAVATLMPLMMHVSRLAERSLGDRVMAMAGRVGAAAFQARQKACMMRPDGRRALARIGCPVLVVAGRQDALAPLDGQRELARRIADADLVVIEGCGHLAPLERPEAVSALLRYWLARGGIQRPPACGKTKNNRSFE